MTLSDFVSVWEEAEAAGLVDGFLGMQYRRVPFPLDAAGRLAWGWRDIVAHANAGPGARPAPHADWEAVKAVYRDEPQ